MKENEKRGYIAVGIISIIFTAVVYLLPTLPQKIGIFYTHLTNPVGWLADAPMTSVPTLLSNFQANSGDYIVIAEGYSGKKSEQIIEQIIRLNKAKQNFLTDTLTFGNDVALEKLIYSQFFGQYFFPYSIYSYDEIGKAEYFAKNLDAPSVLLYGYSWFVNIPVKIISEIKVLFVLDELHNITYGLNFLWIDFVINVLALIFIEIPIAFFNTVIGFFVALIFNPWDSICSVFGFVYFIFYTTLSAVWDFILVLFK